MIHPTLLLAHVGEKRPGDVEGPLKVGLNHPREDLGGHLVHHAVAGDPYEDHKDDLAKVFPVALHQSLDEPPRFQRRAPDLITASSA